MQYLNLVFSITVNFIHNCKGTPFLLYPKFVNLHRNRMSAFRTYEQVIPDLVLREAGCICMCATEHLPPRLQLLSTTNISKNSMATHPKGRQTKFPLYENKIARENKATERELSYCLPLCPCILCMQAPVITHWWSPSIRCCCVVAN